MGSEYALKYMNISNYARILNLPESAEIYLNVGICLNVSNVVTMAEYAWNITWRNKPGI